MDNCSKKGIDKESSILLITGIILLILLVILVIINTETSIVMILGIVMLLCTYEFTETFFDNSGIKKMKAFGWVLMILAMNIMIDAVYDNVTRFEAMFFCGLMIIGIIAFFIHYFKCKEWVEELFLAVGFVCFAFLFAVMLYESCFFSGCLKYWHCL